MRYYIMNIVYKTDDIDLWNLNDFVDDSVSFHKSTNKPARSIDPTIDYRIYVLDTETFVFKGYSLDEFIREFKSKQEDISDLKIQENDTWVAKISEPPLEKDIKFLNCTKEHHKGEFKVLTFFEQHLIDNCRFFLGDLNRSFGDIKFARHGFFKNYSEKCTLPIYSLLRIYVLSGSHIEDLSLEGNIFTVYDKKKAYHYEISNRLKCALVTEALIKGRNSCYT